jgi:hypothetical protein
MDKPEALRLADWFEGGYGGCELEAAAELRRLHDEVQMLDVAYRIACKIIKEQDRKLAKLDLAAAAEREAIGDEFSSRLQSDLENGVRWLNENAASEFNKKYPQLAGFNTWLNKRDGT